VDWVLLAEEREVDWVLLAEEREVDWVLLAEEREKWRPVVNKLVTIIVA
jgi:hypothetical protein